MMQLVKSADIFSQSYRPGGLDAKGFSPMDLVAINPNIIYVTFSAYSNVGPWAERHGYDSLVQSVSGIAHEQGRGIKPEHLPAQSLDYLTGYFGCLGAMEALRRRSIDGGAYEVRVSLARTAEWFKSLGRTSNFTECVIPTREEISELLTQSDSDFGKIEYMKPILQMSETNPHWTWPAKKLGSS
jgi:crotonobetainyl-CoA:carnitine CoA-transferase CaiB-like acyl-CoA transferase